MLFTKDDSVEAFREIVRIIAQFAVRALLLGFPARGALSYGKIFCIHQLMIGKPLVEASDQEGQAEWSGIILTESCENKAKGKILNDLMNEKRIVKWEVPMKCGYAEARYCVNWALYAGKYITGTFAEYFKGAIDCKQCGKFKRNEQCIDCLLEDVKKKITNTEEFLRANVGSEELPIVYHNLSNKCKE